MPQFKKKDLLNKTWNKKNNNAVSCFKVELKNLKKIQVVFV